MLVVLVHGWGVREAGFGALPALLGRDTLEIHLSQYVSYSDDVTMDDLAAAFERARRERFADRAFACVTHSTGGIVMRVWWERYRGPMAALVMLAPPNHGSALAQLGKGRLSRLKCWFEGVEPGQRILDWLELGSPELLALNERWLHFKWPGRLLVVSGGTPDHSVYDHLNSYTGEPGSDGVVRLASANLNFSRLRLRQFGGELRKDRESRSADIKHLLLPGASHAGVLELASKWGTIQSCSLLTCRVVDNAGYPVDEYDLLFTAGPGYSPDGLPRGFCLDRQRNSRARNTITYYLNHQAMTRVRELGILIRPRPSAGPVRYAPAEFRSTMFLRAHETTVVDIVLQRELDASVFAIRDCA